jgi:GNAT superfamily N-acetyltransferase
VTADTRQRHGDRRVSVTATLTDAMSRRSPKCGAWSGDARVPVSEFGAVGLVAWHDPSGHAVGMFREAQPADFNDIVRLYRQLHPKDSIPHDGSVERSFERILDSPGLRLFVLELDGVVVATTYLNVIPNLTRSASPYAVIENVVVEESRRGAGLGKRIMDGTLRAAWAEGCYKAMLMTGSRTPATHHFYRACGFSPDAKTAYLARPLPGTQLPMSQHVT